MPRLFLLLFFFPLLVWGGGCDLFHQLYPEILFSEGELLERFSAAKIISAQEPPAGSAVTIVELEDGVKYVVRQSSSHDFLDFERFASELVRRSPRGQTPQVRTLGGEEAKVAVARMAALNSNLYFGKVPPAQLNLSVFYPMQQGKKYLDAGRSLSVPHGLARDELLAFALDRQETIHSSDWNTYWKDSGPRGRSAIVEELRAAGPEFSAVTVENAREKIPELMRTCPDCFRPLLNKEVASVPGAVRRQLADHWILYTLLGIPDFHSNNWLVHQDVVLAIDLALKSRDFVVGTHTTHFEAQEAPLSWLSGAPVEGQKLMMSWASPEMIQYVRGLDEKTLRGAAQAAGYKLSEDNLSGVLARAKRILKLRD